MKRIIPVVAVVSLLVVGCAKKNTGTQPSAAVPAEQLTPPPAPPAPEPVYTPAPTPVVTPAPEPVETKPTVKAAPAKAPAKAAAPAKTTSSKAYVVKKGDTLSEIAAAHKTTVKKIMAINPEIKKADAIYVGQKLKMP